MADLLGVILAGGTSRRMGTDKALVAWEGRSMAERVAGALGEVTPRRLVVGRRGRLAGLPCLPDVGRPHRGPLAGLATALTIGGGSRVLLVGVDQPFLRPETLVRLVELAGPDRAVAPIDGGVAQVTCAVYPASWREEATAELRAGGSIRTLIGRLPHLALRPDRWRAWGEDGRSWYSVDTPDHLAEGMARYGEGRR